MKGPKRVEVEWEDAYVDLNRAETSASDAVTLHKPAIMKSVGFMLHRDRSIVIVAAMASDAHNADGAPLYRDLLHIPASLVRKVRALR